MTADEKRMLYHYTAPVSSHLGRILEMGEIEETSPNLSFMGPHAGPEPEVVWLSDSADPGAQLWAAEILRT